jgi:hypothetical protein
MNKKQNLKRFHCLGTKNFDPLLAADSAADVPILLVLEGS